MKCDRCGRVMAYEQFFGSKEHFWVGGVSSAGRLDTTQI